MPKEITRREFLTNAAETSFYVGTVGVFAGVVGLMFKQDRDLQARLKEENLKEQEDEEKKILEDGIAKLHQDRELREQYRRKDQETIDKVLWHNQAKLIQDVKTESGMRVSLFQAQTEYNPNFPISVNESALNRTINFMIGSMGLINDKNDRPISPKLIKKLQGEAQGGRLDRVHLTVVTSATGMFSSPEGVPSIGGVTYNSHPHHDDEDEVRHSLKPMICFSPNIFYTGEEIMTPEPTLGRFPKDNNTADLPTLEPTDGQSLSAYFGHEFSHVLMDILGCKVMDDLAATKGDPNYDGGEYQHKSFVLPLNWYHTAAMAGEVQGQPPIPPIFTVAEYYPWDTE